jgi:GTP cyclohydrolase IA
MVEERFFDGETDASLAKSDYVIAEAITTILLELGYDINDPHFKRTPERVAKVMAQFRKNGDPDTVKKLLGVQFVEPGAVDSLVLEGPIDYVSMCAHHMLTVEGVAYVGYLPGKAVCGLSKMARLVDHFAGQYTVQERVTQQVADALVEHLEPAGAMVVVRAKHGCMAVRGVRQPACKTATSAVRGVFKESAAARNEFLSLIVLGGH